MSIRVCEFCKCSTMDDTVTLCPQCGAMLPAPAPGQNVHGQTPNNAPYGQYAQAAPIYPDQPVQPSLQYSFEKPVNTWVDLLLCFFLGYVGAHKFYEGKTGMGILYACTAGLFLIGWLVDIFRILLRPENTPR